MNLSYPLDVQEHIMFSYLSQEVLVMKLPKTCQQWVFNGGNDGYVVVFGGYKLPDDLLLFQVFLAETLKGRDQGMSRDKHVTWLNQKKGQQVKALKIGI